MEFKKSLFFQHHTNCVKVNKVTADLMIRLLGEEINHPNVLSLLPKDDYTTFDSFCTSPFATFKGNMRKLEGENTPEGCNLFTDDPVFLSKFKKDLQDSGLLYYEEEIFSDIFGTPIKFLIVRIGDDDFRVIHEMSSKNLLKVIRR